MKLRSLLPLAALLAAGCGGSGSTRPRLTIRIAWPTQNSRVIPTASNSIRIQVSQGGVTVNDALIVKPATTTTFTEAPVGSVTVTATAYPNTDGSGNAMASATLNPTTVADTTTTVDLTMASTIDHLVVTPNPCNLALLGLLTQQLTVTAYDASNAVVLMAPGDLSYTCTNSLLVNINATGLVTGLILGTSTITVTDAVSGKQGTAIAKVTLT